MNGTNEHDERLPKALVEALKRIDRAPEAITARADHAVSNAARIHFAARRTPRWQRQGAWGAAAACALLIVTLATSRLTDRGNAPIYADIDGSGRIDIADVLALARSRSMSIRPNWTPSPFVWSHSMRMDPDEAAAGSSGARRAVPRRCRCRRRAESAIRTPGNPRRQPGAPCHLAVRTRGPQRHHEGSGRRERWSRGLHAALPTTTARPSPAAALPESWLRITPWRSRTHCRREACVSPRCT